jgi:hypothetical protein
MPEIQHITVQLDGITAGDYLAHQLDADPPLEASRLRSVTLDSLDPLGDSIGAELSWHGRPPSARAAATAAGFALTGDVVDVRSHVELRCGHARQRAPQLLAAAA